MQSGYQQAQVRGPWEAQLSYLPYKEMVEYDKGQTIFSENQLSKGIYRLMEGRVKVYRPATEGTEVVLDVYYPTELFGESGLLQLPARGERAVAMERSQTMFWTTAEIEDLVTSRPELGIALLQLVVRRSLDIAYRLESFASDKTLQRVIRALLRFAERFGVKSEDGTVRLPPMTHQLLSEYVGTSREIVTSNMNQLRQQGCLRYSRKSIELFTDTLSERLRTLS